MRSLLAPASWDVVHVGDIGLGRAADTSILERAKQDNRIVVTLDADFHAILAVTNAEAPSAIWLRRQGMDGPSVARLLESIWPTIETHVTKGAMVTVIADSIKIHRLPVSTT